MNRETQQRFAQVPTIDQKRSSFKRPHTHKTTFNAADIVPIYVDADILPGDTVTMDVSQITRMSTPIYPVMDNAYMDIMFFFVPHRLVWDHWREFWGENRSGAWAQTVEYEIPQIQFPYLTTNQDSSVSIRGWNKGSIADHMGLPTEVHPLISGAIDPVSGSEFGKTMTVNALPFRAYCQIFNDWFRDQNLVDPVYINTDETTLIGCPALSGSSGDTWNYTEWDTQTGTVNNDYRVTAQLGANPLKAAKMHDYFTSALPEPLKGPEVGIPFNDFPVLPGEEDTPGLYNNATTGFGIDEQNLRWRVPNYASGTQLNEPLFSPSATNAANQLRSANYNSDYFTRISGSAETVSAISSNVIPSNLWAMPQYATTITSIDALRTAFAIQEFYEAQARGGSRYIEFIKNIFGVTSPDGRQQRAEYMGGTRFRINIDQVLQTSETQTTPLGNVAAFSATTNSNHLFTHSFTEHGTLMGVALVRTDHTYSQGMEKQWLRKDWTDFYVPQFANLGEQGIINSEIYVEDDQVTTVGSTYTQNEEIFGYQEAWAEYRYKPNMVTGAMRPNYAQTLAAWHYGDYYTELPKLSEEWINETYKNIDRTLAVTSEVEDQFISDFYFDATYVRPMPVYSVPSMIGYM